MDNSYNPNNLSSVCGTTYLAAKNESQQQGHRQLCVAEEYDIEQIRIGRRLQEEPVKDKQRVR